MATPLQRVIGETKRYDAKALLRHYRPVPIVMLTVYSDGEALIREAFSTEELAWEFASAWACRQQQEFDAGFGENLPEPDAGNVRAQEDFVRSHCERSGCRVEVTDGWLNPRYNPG